MSAVTSEKIMTDHYLVQIKYKGQITRINKNKASTQFVRRFTNSVNHIQNFITIQTNKHTQFY
jgi:hypothetical protein